MDIDLGLSLPFERSFEGALGAHYVQVEPTTVAGHIDVRPDLLDRHGHVPLGVYASIAEGSTSMSTAMTVVPQGNLAMGMSNDTTRVGDVSEGRISFVGTRTYASPELWVWGIEFRTEAGTVCAIGTVRVAVRPLPR